MPRMNCLYEGMAGLFMLLKERLLPISNGGELGDALLHLESCKATLYAKEREHNTQLETLAREALYRRKLGDVATARRLLMDRRRVSEKAQRVQACLVLVEKQLDALQSRELDKELLASLRLSSSAMKKAGLAGETEDAEKVMGELDDQIAQSAELTQVLSTPLETGLPTTDTLAFDLDTELGLLETEYVAEAPAQESHMFRPVQAESLPATAKTTVRPVQAESLSATAKTTVRPSAAGARASRLEPTGDRLTSIPEGSRSPSVDHAGEGELGYDEDVPNERAALLQREPVRRKREREARRRATETVPASGRPEPSRSTDWNTPAASHVPVVCVDSV